MCAWDQTARRFERGIRVKPREKNKNAQAELIRSPFSAVPIWLLLGMPVLSMYLTFSVVDDYWPEWIESNNMPAPDAAYLLIYFFSSFAMLVFAAFWFRAGWKCFLIDRPTKHQLLHYSVLAVPLIASAVLAIYLVYFPLSFFWPEFVTGWLLTEQSPFIWPRTDLEAIFGSVINFAAIIVLLPYLEEILFRGFLLNRCLMRWRPSVAIFVTSICFGVFHTDILGAFVFSVVLCLIYMKTGSLTGPLIIHMTNNAIAVLADFVFVFYYGSEPTTMSEFRSYWWISLPAALISIPWLVWYWRTHLSRSTDDMTPVVQNGRD